MNIPLLSLHSSCCRFVVLGPAAVTEANEELRFTIRELGHSETKLLDEVAEPKKEENREENTKHEYPSCSLSQTH